MEDENYNQDEATERARMDQQAFDRLPPAVKLATLLKQENLKKAQGGYVERQKERARKGALLGAQILLIPHLPVLGPFALVLIAIQGALSGYFLVRKELHQLSGVLLFGMGAVVFDLVYFVAGFIRADNMPFVFMLWILAMSGGLLLAIWAKKERDKTDAF